MSVSSCVVIACLAQYILLLILCRRRRRFEVTDDVLADQAASNFIVAPPWRLPVD